MTAKSGFLLLCLLLIALGAGVYLASGPGEAPKMVAKKDSATPGASPSSRKPALPIRPPVTTTKRPISPEEQEKVIATQSQISDLFDAAADGAPEKVETVYAALKDPDAEVREAAVQVLVQLVGRPAIPRLREAMNSTDSKVDQATMAEAIEFLELPTLGEIRAKMAEKNKAEPPLPGTR